ncbi:MAG: hypothetical protein WC310_04535 [Patescibacteria group bacterium]|jgi:hypothetical protein
MTIFRGAEFSTIQNKMPAEEWGWDDFIKDWRDNVNEYLNPEVDVELVVEYFFKPVYRCYSDCLALIKDSGQTTENQEVIVSRLNLAMTNVSEYGQRSVPNIILSIKDKKEDNTSYAKDLNYLLDQLIENIKDANAVLYKKYEEKAQAKKIVTK